MNAKADVSDTINKNMQVQKEIKKKKKSKDIKVDQQENLNAKKFMQEHD